MVCLLRKYPTVFKSLTNSFDSSPEKIMRLFPFFFTVGNALVSPENA